MSRATPLLSFVIAGGGDPDALLGPELAEVEVLVMGDAPAGADPRVRALPAPAGWAAACERGLAEAAGEYIWFLEPGAQPAPGTLAAVAERLRAAAPDVLLVDRGAHRALLARVAGDGVASLDARPGLAAAAPRLADKVFRAAHLRALGVRFADGELAVSWPALLAAERVAAVPRARVRVPRAAPGSAAQLRAEHDAVFAFVAAHPELPESRRRLLLPALVRHGLGVLRRLPVAERPERFAALSETVRRHATAAGGREQRLVARNAYRAYAALEAARRGRRVAGRARRRARREALRVHRWRVNRHYARRRRAPLDPHLAVFAAYWFRGYACNPRAIYEKARELVPEMRGVWVVKRDAVASLPPGIEHVVAGTPEYYDVIARARVFVNNVNFPNHLVKREGTVHVMTHHGTPLKTMGLDLRDSPVAQMDFDALLRRCARWDFSVSQNHFSTEIWERVYPADYESLDVGYPRNDVLVNASEDDVAAVRAELGIEPGRTAVLYAPTHREYRSSYVPVLDVARVADALGPEYVLLVRAHYFYGADRQLADLHRAGRIRDVAAHPSVEQLCLAADVLLTDYSSIMFDYAVLDRPIVIHAPDWEAYRTLRGVYFDLMTEHPGLVTRTEDEVVEALRSGAARGEAATRARAAFRARFCSLEDGRAAERVVRRVWLGEREVSAPRPAPVAG
jgi:CDP-glycerol glycerophosphotransferase